MESQDALSWKGPQRSSSFTPLPRAGTPSPLSGCFKSHPAWPWTFSGIQGQPQLLWASFPPIPFKLKPFAPLYYYYLPIFHVLHEFCGAGNLSKVTWIWCIVHMPYNRYLPMSFSYPWFGFLFLLNIFTSGLSLEHYQAQEEEAR